MFPLFICKILRFLNPRQALCSCEEGFFLYEGACVPCSGPGAHLIDGECSCGFNAEISDDDETCVCNENYLAFEVSYELNHVKIYNTFLNLQ